MEKVVERQACKGSYLQYTTNWRWYSLKKRVNGPIFSVVFILLFKIWDLGVISVSVQTDCGDIHRQGCGQTVTKFNQLHLQKKKIKTSSFEEIGLEYFSNKKAFM